MPPKFAPVFRACWVAGALVVSVAVAADHGPTWVGASRDAVLAQFGEPKSRMAVGSREVLFFAKARVVLRDGKVTEFEELVVEAPPPSSESAVAAAAKSSTSTGSAAPASPPVANPPSDSTTPVEASSLSPTLPVASSGAASEAPTTPTASAEAPSVPEIQIKSVRPRSSVARPPQPSAKVEASAAPSSAALVSAPQPAAVAAPPIASPTPPPNQEPRVPVATAPTAEAAVTPPPAATAAPDTTSATTVAQSASATSSAAVAPLAPTAPAISDSSTTAAASTTPTDSSTKPEEVTPPVPPVNRSKSARSQTAGGQEGGVMETVDRAFTRQTYLIAFATLAIGLGYLIWRGRRRRGLLEATAVSRSPFPTEQLPAASGARFTTELLGKLEWKRFEELVAAYYNTTGVVAARTGSGPASAVHIRVSWKGEQRPFAFVQCIARPSELVGPKAIEGLNAVLESEDIRRGYVVTSGKFGVPARDLAEEKHITLLPGDVFVEKLNALPEVARSELLREATSGDYITPVCPRCDIKMTRAASGSGWQCVQCGDQLAN